MRSRFHSERSLPDREGIRDVPGAAADVGDESPTACCLGEPIQEMPVERLLDQLRGEMCGVGIGGRVVLSRTSITPQAQRLLRYFFAPAAYFFAGAADFGRAWRGS